MINKQIKVGNLGRLRHISLKMDVSGKTLARIHSLSCSHRIMEILAVRRSLQNDYLFSKVKEIFRIFLLQILTK